jgi:hypothetical protein
VKYRPVIIAGLLIALLVPAVYLLLPDNGGNGSFARDLDRNGQTEIYRLENGHLTIREGDRLIWKTPEDWKIQSCLAADADNDGGEELILVLWKKGSFGSSRPMWHKGIDDEYSNHLFLYRLIAGKMKPVWCSSALARPIIELEVQDIDQDGQNELKVLEGRYFSHSYTTWIWQEWGFVQANKGTFFLLAKLSFSPQPDISYLVV